MAEAFCVFKPSGIQSCKCINCGEEFFNIRDCSILHNPCDIEKYNQLNREFFELQAKAELQISKKDRAKRLFNFLKALLIHLKNHSPTCTKKEIKDRYEICKGCGFFDGSICTHHKCGCAINTQDVFFNKLSWADQECPIGKWGKIEK